MKNEKVFISHSSRDMEICSALAELIEGCSLKQVNTWYSSDIRGNRGLVPGDVWFSKIRTELDSSAAAIVLCTPSGVKSDWVIFEAGYGASIANLEIIPVLVGVNDIVDIPSPFANWQMYPLNNSDECLLFLEKLFGVLDIHFDKEFVTSKLTDFLRVASKATRPSKLKKAKEVGSLEQADLRGYFDRKFFLIEQALKSNGKAFSGYNFEFSNMITDGELVIHIDADTSFGNVLDSIYFKIESEVSVFSYLNEWIIRDTSTYEIFDIPKGVAQEIAASQIIYPGRALRVEKMSSAEQQDKKNVSDETAIMT